MEQQRQRLRKLSDTTADLPLANVVSAALRKAYDGQTAPIQRICQRLQKNKDVVGKWWRGLHAPRADDLVTLMSEYDEVFEAVMSMTGREIETETQKAALRKALEILEGEG